MSSPSPQFVSDPFGSGATFAWGQGSDTYIPQPGDADYLAYQKALGNWIAQREQAYKASPKYQEDQNKTNPDVGSGRVPAIGFVAETNNPWGVPVGAKVTSLEKQQSGDYQITYKEKGTPQQVTVSGPGYSISGTIFAANAQEAAAKMASGTRAQYRGIDVSPSRLGGYISDMRGSNQASVQAGDPAQIKYWENLGLPQYSGYSIPKLSASQEAEGFYIKKVEAGGVTPNILVANTEWEDFWSKQGFPEYSDYKPVSLGQEEYIKSATPTEQGLTYIIGNREQDAKQSALELRLTELNRNIDVINRQNEVFTTAVNKGDISTVEFRDAMKVQTQNTLKLISEAESLGVISQEEKTTQTRQLNLFTSNIDSYVLNADKYNKLTASITAENEIFTSNLLSGNISQDDYVKAMGVQNQRIINAINEGAKNELFTPETAKAATVAQSISFQNFLNEVKLNKYTPVTGASNLDNAFRMSGIKQQANLTTNIRQGTKAEGITEAKILGTLTPSEQKEYLRIKTEKALYAGVTTGVFIAAGATIPFSLPTSLTLTGVKVIATEAVLGAGLSVGINQAVKSVSGGGALTLQEAAVSAGEGLLFLGANKLALNAVRVVAPRVAASAAGRVGVATGVGIAGEYVTTGKVTPEGVALAGGMALGFEGIGIGVKKLYNPINAGIKAKLGLSDSNIKAYTPTTKSQQRNLVNRSFNYGDDMGDFADAFYKVDDSVLRGYEARYGSIARASDTGVLGGSNAGKVQVKAKTPSPDDEIMLNLLRPDLADEKAALYWEQRLGKITELKETPKGSNANKNLDSIRQAAENKEFLRLTRPDLAEQQEALELSKLFSPKTTKPIKGSNQFKEPLKTDDITELAKQRMINKGEPEEFIIKAQRVNIESAWGESGVKGLKLYDKPEDGFTAMMKRLKGLSAEEQAKAQMREMGVPEEFIEKSQRVNIESAWGESGVKGGAKGLLRYPDERREPQLSDLLKSLIGRKEKDVIPLVDRDTGLPKSIEDYIQPKGKRVSKPFDPLNDTGKTVEGGSGQQLVMLEKPQELTATKIKTETKKATKQQSILTPLSETQQSENPLLTGSPNRVNIAAFPAIAVATDNKQQVTSDTILNRASTPLFPTAKQNIKPLSITSQAIATTPKISIKQTSKPNIIWSAPAQQKGTVWNTMRAPIYDLISKQESRPITIQAQTQPIISELIQPTVKIDTRLNTGVLFKTSTKTAFPPLNVNPPKAKKKKPKDEDGGLWMWRKHAIPTPKQLKKQAGLGKNIFAAKGLVGISDKFFGKSQSKGKRKKGSKR